MAEPKPRKPRQTALTLKVDEGPRIKESAQRAQVQRLLGLLGYCSLVVGGERRKVRCPQCGHWSAPTGAVGNDLGCPDLLVYRAGWGVMLGIEMKVRRRLKAECTAVAPHQQALADAGATVICRSVAEAIDACERAEAALGLVNPKIAAFWQNNPRRRFE